MADSMPSVTVLLPVLDEIEWIDACLQSLADQDYAGPLSIVAADGGSTDGTRERLAEWTARLDLTVVANPARRQSAGLGVAAGHATGEILVRADAHTTYAPDYVSRSVAALLAVPRGAVGGHLRPEGSSRFGRAVAHAMTSPLATGPGRFHRSGASGDVDTVYLGAFRAVDFAAVGGFRTFPSGAGEDAEFYFRMRRTGRRVVLDPSIRSTYRPRENPGRLFRQHFRYGQAKAEMLWVNGVLPSWRPLAPALLVLGLVAGLVAGLLATWPPLAIVVAAWGFVIVAVAATAPRLAPWVIAATAIMHLSYGLGMWWGLLRGPGPVRRSIA